MSNMLNTQKDVNQQCWTEQSWKVPCGCHSENVAAQPQSPVRKHVQALVAQRNDAFNIFSRSAWLSSDN